MTDSDTYQYEHEGDRNSDERHAWKARDLARAGIFDEAINEAGKLYHYERSTDLIDEIVRKRRRENRNV